jgi:altronate dehydratase
MWGYERECGAVGVRNYVLISSLSDLTNDVAFRIADASLGAVAVLSARGGLSFGAAEELDGRLQRRLATHPNVGAVLAIATSEPELNAFVDQVQGVGRPVRALCAFGDVDTQAAVRKGAELVRELRDVLTGIPRVEVGARALRIGLRSSATTAQSAMTAHVAVGGAITGLLAAGARAAFTELADLAGVIDQTAARAADSNAAAAVRTALQEVRAVLDGLGSEAPDPTPLNRLGGIRTLHDKGEAALRRLGAAPIRGVFGYGDQWDGPGLHMMIGPGSAAISLVGLTAAHCTVLLYTVGATTWVPSSPLCPAVMVGGPGLVGSADLDVVTTGSPDDASNVSQRLIHVANGGSSSVEQRAGRFIALPHCLATM